MPRWIFILAAARVPKFGAFILGQTQRGTEVRTRAA